MSESIQEIARQADESREVARRKHLAGVERTESIVNHTVLVMLIAIAVFALVRWLAVG